MKDYNIAKILKNTKRGARLYSPIFGEVEFVKVDWEDNEQYPIVVMVSNENDHHIEKFTATGRFYNTKNGECLLWPSSNTKSWEGCFWIDPLPIDSPVMVFDGISWNLRYYAGDLTCYSFGLKSKDTFQTKHWDVIVPFEDFDPNNIEESMKRGVTKP